MKNLILSIVFFAAALAVTGQTRYFTKNGKIYFDATSSDEKIEGTNEKAFSVISDSAGAIEFAVLMRAFIFEKALLEEHFHENYLESDKYPKATFKGIITNFNTVDKNKNGIYPVKIKGMLTLHGETKEVLANGSLTIKDGKITAGKSQFKILLEDFKIEIPSLVKDKISREAKISVDVIYEPLKTS